MKLIIYCILVFFCQKLLHNWYAMVLVDGLPLSFPLDTMSTVWQWAGRWARLNDGKIPNYMLLYTIACK